MDHVGVVVDDLEAAIAFLLELGLELEGEAAMEGPWVDRVVGLEDVRVDIAMVRTPDGHGRLELTKFHTPTAVAAELNASANTLGIRRIMFAVEDIEDVLARLHAHGAELVGELNQYRTAIGSATSATPRALSLRWPSSSAEENVLHRALTTAVRLPQQPASRPHAGSVRRQCFLRYVEPQSGCPSDL
jgi:catechol 2,3-dioxygenase-like lactoylglutathione lyase family enzyme